MRALHSSPGRSPEPPANGSADLTESRKWNAREKYRRASGDALQNALLARKTRAFYLRDTRTQIGEAWFGCWTLNGDKKDVTCVGHACKEVTGKRQGTEVVQLYGRDLVGTVTRPVKELKGFRKVTLNPGEAQTVSFQLGAADLFYTRRDLTQGVEPGRFKIWIGPNCREGIEKEFELIGD